MNRISHLKETLFKNIADNILYKNVEFILLDYNSTDGLENWVKSNFVEYLNNGFLKFYKTTVPQSFHRSNSRNIAMKLGTGDILCNLDADNYLGEDFAFYINYHFNFKENIFLTSGLNNGSYGKACVRREDFFKIRGYNEKMSGWGYEDNDLFHRLEKTGLKKTLFSEKKFTRFINHPVESSFKNDYEINNIKAIYIAHLNTKKTILLYLNKDNSFVHGILFFSEIFKEARLEDFWKKGTVEYAKNELVLFFDDGGKKVLTKSEKLLTNGNEKFFLITNDKLLNRSKILLTSLNNIIISEKVMNDENSFSSNEEIWGDIDLKQVF